MPIHDWSKAEGGLFHSVHNAWLVHLLEHLNTGGLPAGYFAMTEARVGVYEPDLATARRRTADTSVTGVVTLPAPDRRAAATMTRRRRQQRLKVFGPRKQVVAVVEVVSPANKDRKLHVAEFANKAADFLAAGVSVSFADVLPATPAAPHGMHPPVWRAVNRRASPDLPPADRPLTFAAYEGGGSAEASLYYAAVGQSIPALPLFLDGDQFVLLPLEETYMTTITRLPPELRETLGGRPGG